VLMRRPSIRRRCRYASQRRNIVLQSGGSSHTKLVDVQLHSTMRTIIGTLRPTPTMASGAQQHRTPHICCEAAAAKIVERICVNTRLPLHNDVFKPSRVRLSSRRPVWSCMPCQDTSMESMWHKEWSNTDVKNNSSLMIPPPVSLASPYPAGHGPC
jgi:hypothetical protein